MTEEEKAVFTCLEDDNGEYDELEDDFLMLANEGKPALEVVEETAVKGKSSKEEFANKGVVIVKDDVEEQLNAIRAQMKLRMQR